VNGNKIRCAKTSLANERNKACWKVYFTTLVDLAFVDTSMNVTAYQLPRVLPCRATKQGQSDDEDDQDEDENLDFDESLTEYNGDLASISTFFRSNNKRKNKYQKKYAIDDDDDNEEQKENEKEIISLTKEENQELALLQKTYFAIKFVKSFFAALQRKQGLCLIHFIESQQRLVLEPKNSAFRLILFQQSLERVSVL
jgi:hypothetical protein